MAQNTVANAWVQLMPSFQGGSREISRQLNGPLDGAGRDGGRRFGAGMAAGIGGLASRVFAPLAAAAAGVGLVNVFKDTIAEASDLGESVNAVNVVFGDAASAVLKLGENAAKSVGLSNVEFNGLAVQFSSFASKIGGPGGTAATLEELTTRAADFASVMNLEVSEAAGIFQSALSGETEPIKQFGIDLSAAAVEAYAAANGIGAVGEQLTATEKVQATYGLLMAETAKTQGDFANTSDSLANRQRILGATIDNIKASLGAGLLPVMESAFGFILDKAVPAVTTFIENFKNGEGAAGTFRDILTGIKDAAVGVANFFTGTVVPAFQVFFGAFKFGGMNEFEGGLRNINNAGVVLGDLFRNVLVPAFQSVVGYLKDLWTAARTAGDTIATGLKPAWDEIVAVWNSDLKPAFQELFKVLQEELGPIFGSTAGEAKPLIANLAEMTVGLVKFLLPSIVRGIQIFAILVKAIAAVIGPMKDAYLWSVNLATQFGLVTVRAQAMVRDTISGVRTMVSTIVTQFRSVRDGIAASINGAVAAVRGLPGNIRSALGNLGDTLYSAGQALISGLIRGIQDRLSGALSAVRNAASAIANTAKSALGIRSPSRVFREIGGNVVEGLALGLSDTSSLEAASRNMTRSVVAPSVSAIGSAAGASGSGAGLTINAYGAREEVLAAEVVKKQRQHDALMFAGV